MNRPRDLQHRGVGLLAVLLLSLAVALPAGAQGVDPQAYRPPVTAPVADPFRPPPEPWQAGNRGIEYRTVPGTTVAAIGPGRVTFAGWVAGRRVVTVDHPDGLRSSYLPLAWIGVAVGDQVAGGATLGRSTDLLHLGVRRGEVYLDPASLWGRSVGAGRVVLVPLDPGPGHPGDRSGAPDADAEAGPWRPRLTPTDLAGPALGLAVAAVVAGDPPGGGRPGS